MAFDHALNETKYEMKPFLSFPGFEKQLENIEECVFDKITEKIPQKI